MAYGITRERTAAIGLESAAGTAVVATQILRGPANSIVDEQEAVFPDENVGKAGQQDRAYIPSIQAGYASPETTVTFEQTPITLSASVANVVSGSTTGSTPAGYGYTYAVPSTNSAATQKTYTLEVGNNQAAYKMEYGFVTDFALKGSSNNALTYTANWRGRQKATVTRATPALVSVEDVLFQNGKLYYDALGGTLGATVQTGSWLGFNIKHVSGWKPVYTGDGNLYFALPVFKTPEITGDITIEDSTLAATIRAAQSAKTTGLVRMLFEGSTIGTGGTYQKKTLRIDLAVKWINTPGVDSQNDDDIYTFPFRVVETASVYCTYLFVNALTAIAA